MVKVVVDTSVIIEKARMKGGLYDQLINDSIGGFVSLISSVVVLAELWAGKRILDDRNMKDVEEIVRPVEFVGVDANLAKKAGEILREHSMSGFDAIIAATALIHKAQLATLNKRHFEKVRGLRLYN